MRKKSIITTPLFIIAIAILIACQRAGSFGEEKVIKSMKSGDLTVTISNSTGELKKGSNDLMVTFTGASGTPVDVGAASLNFHMAAMGSMAEMNDKATLTTTDTPGKYHAKVDIGMAGTWEAQIKYQGAHGTGQVSTAVQVK